ncbi:MAG: DUF4465 domain-containing protein [Sedimentisphaerales bacterium]
MVKAQQITDFEDLALEKGSYWNGSDGSGGFTSGSAWFTNNYDTMYGSWDGFAYSNITDTTTQGWAGQYNAITGGGQGGSATYAVGYIGWITPPTMVLDEPMIVSGLYVTNNNYAYYTMLYGGLFGAKKFGDSDWFLLTMTGKDATGAVTGTVNFYLADGTDIVNEWEYVNLASLGVVKSVEFNLSSSDNGAYGMNTPGYFVIDTVIPEPASLVLLTFAGMIGLRRRKS